MKEKGINTKCIHGFKNDYDNTGAVSVPIYQSATFAHTGLGQSTGFDYSRLKNPTREHLEKTIANLEGGLDAVAFSTGMGAIATVMEMFNRGDHIIASDDLYGGSHRLFHIVSMKKGVEFDFVDTADTKLVANLVRKETKAIYVESPTNPMMHVTDIKAIATITSQHKLHLIVDNTFMTPYFQQPLKMGADIVIHSGTKYLGGHNDTLAGLVVTSDEGLLEHLRLLSKTLGACLSPMDAWLIIRGIKTLPIRMERQQATAKQLAQWLSDQDWVKKIYYIGLPTDPGYATTNKQACGYGSMISIEVDSVEHVERILGGVQVIQFAESLGGVETLMTYPMTQTHADVPEEERDSKGINDCLLRLSIGLEDYEDLINDFQQAMAVS